MTYIKPPRILNDGYVYKSPKNEIDPFTQHYPKYYKTYYFKFDKVSRKTGKLTTHVIISKSRNFDNSLGMLTAALFPIVPIPISENEYNKLSQV